MIYIFSKISNGYIGISKKPSKFAIFMHKEFNKNIFSLILLSLLFIGLVSRSACIGIPATTSKSFSTKQKNETPVAKLDLGTNAMAVVPILSLEFPEWCASLSFNFATFEVLSDTCVHDGVTLQEKFFKILFRNIMAANAP